MKLYICDLPVVFPRSEYGGMVVIAANSKKEVTRALKDAYEWHKEYFDMSGILENATIIDLVEGCDIPAGIVRVFET